MLTILIGGLYINSSLANYGIFKYDRLVSFLQYHNIFYDIVKIKSNNVGVVILRRICPSFTKTKHFFSHSLLITAVQ